MKKIITFLILLYSINNFSQKCVDCIYDIKGLEVPPEFPGGKEKLNTYLHENLLKVGFEMPKPVKGKPSVKAVSTFVVEKDGSLGDIKVLGKIDSLKAGEVIKILKSSPKWSPGKQNGTIVRTAYVVPL